MPTISMHAEATPEPDVIRWVVRGDLVRGPAVIREISDEGALPAQWEDALSFGDLSEIVIGTGELRIRVNDVDRLDDLAPRLQRSLEEFLAAGNRIDIQGDRHTDAELAAAVVNHLNGPLADYVASHGGEIELCDVTEAVVTVRLLGACDGCAAAGSTLREGIEEQLKRQYPEIVEVRAIEGPARAENGRPLLPFLGSR